MTISRLGYCASILCLLISMPVQAQEFGRVGRVQSEDTSYHIYTTPGKATIQILVMGVANAGVYEIAEGTDLGELLAVTGATLNPRESKIRVKLYREQGPTRTLIYDASMEEVMGAPENYPVLAERDFLMVEAEARGPGFRFTDLLAVVTTLSTLALLVDRYR